MHECRKPISFSFGLIHAFVGCQPPDRKIVFRRLGVGSGGLTVAVIAGPHGKNAVTQLPPDIAVTNALLLSKLHHITPQSAVLLRRRLRSLLPLLPLLLLSGTLSGLLRGREK